jgi:excisionase family DNA binding protein
MTPTDQPDLGARETVGVANTRLLTAEELAGRWTVSKAHVYRLAREGGLPVVKIGRYYRSRLSTVEAWEAAQEAASDA